MQAKTALHVLLPTDKFTCSKVEDLVSDWRKAGVWSFVCLLSETQRDVSRDFEFSLDQDLWVVFELNGQIGGSELRWIVANRKFRHLLDELSFLENKIALWDSNNIESLSDFDFEVFSDFVILSSKIEPTTRVTNVEHHFGFKIKGTDQVKKFPTRQTNMYLRLFLCSQNVSILLLSLLQIFF